VAARFLIDAGGVGGGILSESVSRERADAVIGPSTPASSLFQKTAENTIQAVIREVNVSEAVSEGNVLGQYSGSAIGSGDSVIDRRTFMSTLAIKRGDTRIN
jgi:2-phospho-L-lactate transferase/gluconeogenesis factor (CofD/UPF0052 family)